VPEAVRRRAELDRHEGVPRRRPVEAVATSQHIVDHGLARDLGKMLVDQQPLVVPKGHLARDQELHIAVAPVAGSSGREAGEVVLG
jgi:hypothetical protein